MATPGSIGSMVAPETPPVSQQSSKARLVKALIADLLSLLRHTAHRIAPRSPEAVSTATTQSPKGTTASTDEA